MEVNQVSEGGKNGVKEEIKVVPEVGNENEVSVDGSENGNERLGGVDTSEESIDVDGENVVESQKDEFLNGDLVWGKIRSHPWWPGVIHDPSDASDFALKFKNENKLLVAYFGDGSCAWCSRSQLVPFVEHYEKMSKQSSSKSFVYAVEEALVELGRRVELKMICSCVPKDNITDLARPEAMNAGVRSGIPMPDGAIGKLPSRWSEPAFLLEYVRNLKQAVPVSNSLELVLMKSWLSAFSRVKKGCCLPIYREPQLIEGFEDLSKNPVPDTNDFSVPIAVPIQGPSEEECAGSPKMLPVKGLMVTSTQKRKQKSVAELMIDNQGVKLKGKKNSKITEETPSTAGSVRGRKKKDNSVSRTNVVADDPPNSVEDESLLSIKRKQETPSTAGSMRGRKKKDNSVSRTNVVADDPPNSVEDESLLSIKRKQETPSTAGSMRGRKKKDNFVSRNDVVADDPPNSVEDESLRSIKRKQDDDTVQDDTNTSNARRKRRKKKADNSVSSVLVNDVVQLERVENESSQLIELKKSKDPVDDVDGDSDEKTLKRYISRERKNSKYLSPPYTISSPKLRRSYSRREPETKSDKIATLSKVGERLTKVAGQLISSPRLTQCNNAVSEEMSESSLKIGTNLTSSQTISASADQVCAEVLSAGVDIMSMDRKSIEPLKAFMNAFRGSKYHDQKSCKEMKSSASEPGENGTDLNNAAVVSAQPAGDSEKTDKPRSRVTKLKKAARAAAGDKKEVDKTSPDALIVSFGPDASLPSKDEIIMTFNKFGSINEDETKLLHDSNCAEVVFISTSNAELAFKESIKQSPFPGNHVEYNLRYSSDASRALESGKTTSRSPKKRSSKKLAPLQPTGGDVSQVGVIRQNLVNLTSMLNQCNGEISAEEKSSLEGELRSMLQKVGELGVKASSS